MIRIFGVCKNDLFLKMIDPMLNTWGISIAAITRTTNDAVQKFIESKADIVILDANWNYTSLSAKDILANFLNHDKSCKVVMITTFYDPKIEEQFFTLGAQGYIYRNVTSLDSIVECITSVYDSLGI